MALIYCPDCGTQVSEHAQVCTKCAYPISKRNNQQTESNQKNSTLHNVNSNINTIQTNNTIIWILAFAPIIGAFLEGLMMRGHSKFWFFTLALNILLCYLDDKKLKEAGVDTEKIGSYWLIPVYLYNRANYLGQNQAYFWVWIATFVFSFIL
jgi:ribosomal protein L37E